MGVEVSMFILSLLILARSRFASMRRCLSAPSWSRRKMAMATGVLFSLAGWLLLSPAALAQTSGSQSTGGDSGSIFGFQITESRIAFTLLASLISPVLVSIVAKLDTKGWQKTALNVAIACLLALGSWFVDKFGTSEYVIQALSIFIVASGIYAANKGGFTSLTGNVGRT